MRSVSLCVLPRIELDPIFTSMSCISHRARRRGVSGSVETRPLDRCRWNLSEKDR